jgi:phospholipid/cholesterol/gamma-HCH transport system substrate-binding protein
MNNKESGFTWKLGMFVLTGLVVFVLTIYFVGKQKNLFGSTFRLKAQFKTVSGLKVGNNVRLAGINIGTVDDIEILTDTSVMVNLVIKKEVQQFIKADAKASIGSDGLMGDKVLTISSGSPDRGTVKDNDLMSSKVAIEMDDIMSSVKTSVDNAAIISTQLAQFSSKMNSGNGALSKLISDEQFSGSLKGTLVNLETSSTEFARFMTKMNNGKLGKALDSTMINIQAGTKGLNETIEAAQHNFLLRGFFKKKKKAELKKLEEAKKKNDLKNAKDSIMQ